MVKGLTAGKLIDETYNWIREETGDYKDLVFEDEGVYSLVAVDANHHRWINGHMVYKSAMLLQIGDRTWLLAKGEFGGGYPARHYERDIFAAQLRINGKSIAEIISEVKNLIEETTYFRNSIIGAMRQSRIFTPRSWLGHKMGNFIKNLKTSEFLVVPESGNYSKEEIERAEWEPEGRLHVILWDVKPYELSLYPLSYKKELAEVLAQFITQILTSI
jgi:hypothetical protein